MNTNAAAPTDLLSAIRDGAQLKKVEQREETEIPVIADEDDVATALRTALAKRIAAVAGSDSDDSDESEW